MRRIALCGDSRHHQAIFAGEADTIDDYGKEIVQKESSAACSQINESYVRLLSLSLVQQVSRNRVIGKAQSSSNTPKGACRM